jgi:DNA-binding LacI/PurR family transcriptional regulator
MVNTRRERLSAFSRHAGALSRRDRRKCRNAASRRALDNTLRQFHTRHRGCAKAVISANGALTLQVARSLKRIGLHWGSDIGLLGLMNWSGRSWLASALPPSNSPPGRLAMPLLNKSFVVLKAPTMPFASRSSPAS